MWSGYFAVNPEDILDSYFTHYHQKARVTDVILCKKNTLFVIEKDDTILGNDIAITYGHVLFVCMLCYSSYICIIYVYLKNIEVSMSRNKTSCS